MILEDKIRIISKIKDRLSSDYSARLFSLMISGSELYGFSSPDSDLDLRGIFVYNTNRFLGLDTPKDVIELDIDDLDIVLFEVKKAMNLAFKGNCNEMEHLRVNQIYTTPFFLELRELVPLNKVGLYNSYRGLSHSNYKKFILKGRKNTVKKYLYVFRGLMAGIYVLETGRIQPNIEQLNRYFKIPELKELIKLKRKGLENSEIPSSLDTGVIEAQFDSLFGRIDKAYIKTTLKEPNRKDREKLSRFLVRVRKRNLDT